MTLWPLSLKITVLGVKGHQVRLGFDAPKEISVHREEIYERIQQEKQSGGATPEEGSETPEFSDTDDTDDTDDTEKWGSLILLVVTKPVCRWFLIMLP